MKKVLSLMLTLVLLFGLVACGSGDDSSNGSSSASQSSSAASSTSSASSSSKVDSTTSTTTSSGSTSSDVSKESFIPAFVTFGGPVDTKVNPSSPNALKLTGIDKVPVKGSVILFTKAYGKTIKAGNETYADYAVLVCTYDHKIFTYKRTSFKDVGADAGKANTAIPDDGFVIVFHKDQAAEITKAKTIKDADTFFVHGIQIGVQAFDLKKATNAPKIDGAVTAAEWGNPIWDVNEKNVLWDYSQFEVNKYYVTAKVYAMYDAKNIYFAVVVDSPYHYNPLSQDKAVEMWQYECIQVSVLTKDPRGDYIKENFDFVSNKKAPEEGVLRGYGFGVNTNNESLHVLYQGTGTKDFTGQFKGNRDAGRNQTIYEVAIPWAEFGDGKFAPKTGESVGFAVSINSTNEDDKTAGKWKNVRMRDGGGIIGRNDLSKIASMKLK